MGVIGLPMGFEYSVSAVGALAMQGAINSFGTVTVTAQTTGEKIRGAELRRAAIRPHPRGHQERPRHPARVLRRQGCPDAAARCEGLTADGDGKRRKTPGVI